MATSKKSNQTSNEPAHIATLNKLIAAKQLSVTPKDGRLELALAIASTTNLVTVDTTSVPFATTPDDLFDRTFDDKLVGVSDDQMPVVKANLTVLLPEIADDISQIPDNAATPIEKVAEFVRLSLLAHSQSD
ncbi:MAG: hypothetical protein ACLQBK_11865 [Candidatus Sulfotelmatobacter sp.]